MSKLSPKHSLSVVTTLLAVASAMSSGCGLEAPNRASVSPRIVLTNRMRTQLASGALKSMDGTFGAGCTDRSGAWSVAIDNNSDPLNNAALTVVKNDVACVLTLTALNTSENFGANPAIDMTDSYQLNASAFAVAAGDGGSAPKAFFANAAMDSLAFDANFVISVLYSDDASLASGSASAAYAAWSSSATSEQVPAPDYSIDLTGLSFETDADNIVTASSGNAVLTDGLVVGQKLVILTSLVASPSFADIDAAFVGGTAVNITQVDQNISAAALQLDGLDLTTAKKRFIIVANDSSGVRSYELITVTINGA